MIDNHKGMNVYSDQMKTKALIKILMQIISSTPHYQVSSPHVLTDYWYLACDTPFHLYSDPISDESILHNISSALDMKREGDIQRQLGASSFRFHPCSEVIRVERDTLQNYCRYAL